MRTIAVAVALVTFGTPFIARAEEVVTIRLTPDPAIATHLEGIQGPTRSTSVRVHDSAQSPAQAVAVRGPIGESDVGFLVRSVLGADASYGKPGTGWSVRVVGDAKYAVIKVAMICGSLCGSGASYTYSFSDGRWTYEYTSEQWIS
jgi:hypothetical protein